MRVSSVMQYVRYCVNSSSVHISLIYLCVIGSSWITTAWLNSAQAGPYAPAAGFSGAVAISATSSSIVEWASGAQVQRGLRDISNSGSGVAYYGGSSGTPANNAPIGMPPQPQSNAYGVALGQGGAVTVTFDKPIADGSGYDFAVFGNGFSVSSSAEWAKPAFVQVSSDGTNFFAFPSVSLTSTASQSGSFAMLDPTNLYDFAGKDPIGWGTPFDLSELAGTPGLNLDDIIAVRMVDVVGNINPAYATYDSQGHKINSPWPASSAVGSEGFVLAGVGVVNAVPEPGSFVLLIAGLTAGLATLRSNRRKHRWRFHW